MIESLSLTSDSGACLDIKASGFWGCQFQPTFLMFIFQPLYAPSNRSNPYSQREAAKRHQYEECVHEIMGALVP